VVPPWDRLGYAIKHSRTGSLVVPLDRAHSLVVPTEDYGAAITQLMGAYSTLTSDRQAAFVDAVEGVAGARAADSTAPLFMTWDQIRCLRKMGHTIGGHTHTHPILSQLSPEEQRNEIRISKQILDDRLGQNTRVFAYPYGKPVRSFSTTTKQIVAECGYEVAFSFYGGWNSVGHPDPFDVRRIKVDPGTSIWRFRARVASRGAIPV
jgi:peptidoglycan/xylan/chitin deacetylase (PgdA/CDA1 family)